MAIENYVVISGVTGVHKLQAPRTNGVFIYDTAQSKVRFVAAKTTDVTPLGMISVFTETEEGAIALGEVFARMRDGASEHPVPATDSQSQVLRSYFAAVISEHDQDRVRIADIKKMVKWYHYMVDQNILDEVLKPTPTEDTATETVEEPAAEPKKIEKVAKKTTKSAKTED
jgi:hypothetical protein